MNIAFGNNIPFLQLQASFSHPFSLPETHSMGSMLVYLGLDVVYLEQSESFKQSLEFHLHPFSEP